MLALLANLEINHREHREEQRSAQRLFSHSCGAFDFKAKNANDV